MLDIRNLDAGYGKKQVLFNLSLEINEGEIVALIGPNGAGKSTILKAVCGLVPLWNGEIIFNQTVINGFTPPHIVSLGITFAPQGHQIFDELTVIENLEIGGFQLSSRERKERVEEVLEIFPQLKNRLPNGAASLSGGEQQMLAVARALIPKPKLLMLDEPSLGLSPNLVNAVFNKVSQINREIGVSVLIVEQKVSEVLDICHRVYSLKLGKIAFSGYPDDLSKSYEQIKELFL